MKPTVRGSGTQIITGAMVNIKPRVLTLGFLLVLECYYYEINNLVTRLIPIQLCFSYL
jgi:hypothetical protein